MLLQKNYARLLGENSRLTNSYENETFQVARMIEERYNKKHDINNALKNNLSHSNVPFNHWTITILYQKKQ